MRITSAVLWQLDGPPASTSFHSGPVTDFAGYYAGLNIGGLTDPQFNFFDDYGWGWHLSRFEIGTLAGYNLALNDTFRAGVEAQLGVNFDTSGDAGLDVLALGHLGVVPVDGLYAYAAAGLGVVEGDAEFEPVGKDADAGEQLGIRMGVKVGRFVVVGNICVAHFELNHAAADGRAGLGEVGAVRGERLVGTGWAAGHIAVAPAEERARRLVRSEFVLRVGRARQARQKCQAE